MDYQTNTLVNISDFLKNFQLNDNAGRLFDISKDKKTETEKITINDKNYTKFINEYWTAKQRQANSLHEISYRACFKPQLPAFFIELLSKKNDTIYDPFNGRGTTVIEAALRGRNIIGNDINPLSTLLSEPRLFIPDIKQLIERLDFIIKNNNKRADINLSMFYHPKTESEIVELRNYLKIRKNKGDEDQIDKWIRMVATNRLTGHSTGFFSVYTLPPNQAVSADRQEKINKTRNQKPDYRDVKSIIINKSKNLIKDIDEKSKNNLLRVGKKAKFFSDNASQTKNIKNSSVQLTVTSPPFLDVVQYAQDNWLRCWFNDIDVKEIEKRMTMSKNIDDWRQSMQQVFNELYRITKNNGWVAFEVGEVKNGKIKLDEHIVPIGENSGFDCRGILINEQIFTKTANIWGIKNNGKGTNTNRIVIFHKK
jgi:DNA modification methylase